MYLEDVLLHLHSAISSNSRPYYDLRQQLTGWERNFITDVADRAATGRALSTKQSAVLLKIIASSRTRLVACGILTEAQVEQVLANPQHRQEVYETQTTPREVRYLGDNLLGFRFSPLQQLLSAVKALGNAEIGHYNAPERLYWTSGALAPRFNQEYRIWIVPVYHHNLDGIEQLISAYGFSLDQSTVDYLRSARLSLNQGNSVEVTEDAFLLRVSDNFVLAQWAVYNVPGMAL